MNQAAIIHRPTSDYIYPSSRNTLELQLITARGDADEAELWYWMRYETDPAKIRRQRLHVSLQDALHDYYRTTVCTGQIAAYTRYCFHLRAGTDELWLGANGLQETEPAMNGNFFEFLWPNPTDGFSAPGWRGRQVYYQIFPERFKNGDPSRTPADADAWGAPPTRENFMGGDLAGITEGLDYIQSLGVTCLYLTPIFRSPSNHKYDTADYFEIDPAFGTKDDLRRLVDGVHARGMRIILDGVFNHTGSNSRYFNAEGYYPEPGAAQSQNSEYYNWYSFHPWPSDYDAWWGVKTLPAVNEAQPAYRDFIFGDQDSVVRHWLRCGADGWRLDVADELPGDFIEGIRRAMDAEKSGGYLLGEVWEDGSNKIAYSHRRRYLLGRETHGLMNYPFRTALLAWLGGGDAADFRRGMETIRENYPPAAFYGAMNFLGTHDTARILTLLGAEDIPADKPERAAYRLSPAALARGQQKLRLAGMLLYSFPGSPTLYYGDEAGMQGFEDPLNRGTYPWGQEDEALLAFFRQVGKLRQTRPSLRRGEIRYLYAQGGGLVIERRCGGERTVTALNAGDVTLPLTLDWDSPLCCDGITGQQFLVQDGKLYLTLPPLDGVILL